MRDICAAVCPSRRVRHHLRHARVLLRATANDIRYDGNVVERIILRGAEPEYADAIPLFSVAQGRFISRFDEEHARQWW